MKDVLKYLRQTGGFTQADAAKMIGVSRQSYSKYENGTVVPSDALVAKIAKVYGVDEAFIRANKIPSISGSNVEYKLDGDAKVPNVASPKSYDAYFDGNTVRVLGKANFYEGQKFKLVTVDDGEEQKKACEILRSYCGRLKPGPENDPYYEKEYHDYLEGKYGFVD
ncbi:MAG: helix-turn-helix transcriptional regulator [Treponema sp.]|nr:helix-turn-helix transcriptional regulator [Treponema sp.]